MKEERYMYIYGVSSAWWYLSLGSVRGVLKGKEGGPGMGWGVSKGRGGI